MTSKLAVATISTLPAAGYLFSARDRDGGSSRLLENSYIIQKKRGFFVYFAPSFIGVNDIKIIIFASDDDAMRRAILTLIKQPIAATRRPHVKVIAVGSIVKPPAPEQRQQVMTGEVPATLKLYLDGRIEQFWYRQDAPGVIFLMNVASVEQAKATVEALPLVTGGYAKYEFMQVGPLAPLGMLIQEK